MKDIRDLNTLVRQANQKFRSIRDEMGKVIVGQTDLIDRLLIGLLAGGHILLEGVPGLAKTLAITTLSKIISCDFKRIQFTPDLLPADLIGTRVFHPEEGTFSVEKGPIFTHLVLADEINRAPAKVQSALLEVMAERQVTIGKETFQVPDLFLVLATQNPIEQEGTYPLPEAQADRFMMKVKLHYPSREEEGLILSRMSVSQRKPQVSSLITQEEVIQAREVIDEIYVDQKVTDYLLDVVFATRNPQEYKVPIENWVEYGVSPRASLDLLHAAKCYAFLDGRGFVTPHDVKSVALDVMRHRLRLTYEAEAEGMTTDAIICRVLETLRVP